MAQKHKKKPHMDQSPVSIDTDTLPTKKTTPDTKKKETKPFKRLRLILWGLVCVLLGIVLYVYGFMIPNLSVRPVYVAKTPKAPEPVLTLPADEIPTPVLPTPTIAETPEEPEQQIVVEIIEQEKDESEETAVLKAQIDALKKADTKTLVDTLTLYHLMANGHPYRNILKKVLSNRPDNPFAARVQSKLTDFELTGIPTLNQLQQMYLQDAKMAAHSFYVKKDTLSWQDNIRAFLKSLVQIRPTKIDDKDLTGVKILYKAGDELKAGNIQKAVTLLQKLPPEQAVLMADFMRNATARVTLNNIMTTLIREERN